MSGRRLILTYHAIEDGPGPLCIEPSRFREHLAVIAESGARAVTLDQLVEEAHEGSATAPTVAITFDDAFASTVDDAVPLLLERDLPATIFCVAGHLGGFNDFATQAHGATLLRLASAESLAALPRQAVDVGSHGMEHRPLSGASEDIAVREIVDSRQALEEAIGTGVRWFAYPYGAGPSDGARDLVRRTYTGACTAENRAIDRSADPFALPRVDAHYLRRPALLRRVLEGEDLYLRLRRIGARARRRLRPDFRSPAP
jgi:peptidoglycan/xylan/chitin deacetylase (PgdA/CDA1 family)